MVFGALVAYGVEKLEFGLADAQIESQDSGRLDRRGAAGRPFGLGFDRLRIVDAELGLQQPVIVGVPDFGETTGEAGGGQQDPRKTHVTSPWSRGTSACSPVRYDRP